MIIRAYILFALLDIVTSFTPPPCNRVKQNLRPHTCLHEGSNPDNALKNTSSSVVKPSPLLDRLKKLEQGTLRVQEPVYGELLVDKDEPLYEDSSKYADPFAVATDCVIEVTSKEHLDKILTTAAGVVPGGGYVDRLGQFRNPHKLIVIYVFANWCRACMGVRPAVLKMCKIHPEVLCLKLNKGEHEDVASALGIRGLPTFIFYKNGKRIDHFSSADRDTIEQAIADNT